ncbi:MAG: energy-coupling factor transporter transmembrane component T family protein [Nitrososphaeria archaeon]
MSTENSESSKISVKSRSTEETERRSAKKYVKTFIFSMRIGTPVEKLHVLTKALMIVVFSVIALYMFDRVPPDLYGLALLVLLVFVLLLLARVGKYLVTSYLALALPVLLGEFIWWLVFNRNLPGETSYIYLWPGFIPIGVSTVIFVLVLSLVYLRTRNILSSFLTALIIWYLFTVPGSLDTSSLTTWFRIPIGRPIGLLTTTLAEEVAVAKALGFAVLIYTSFLFLLTTRDSEIAGALIQLKMSFKQAFFIALMFRNLNILLIDYDNIRTAQRARGATVTRRSFFSRVVDLAYISVPLVASMIRRATEMGVALYARGFESSKRITYYKETKPFTYVDAFIWIIMTLLLVYIIIMHGSITLLIDRFLKAM